MNLLARLLALCGALLLALPPGWCCAAPGAAVTEPAPAGEASQPAGSCCHHAPPAPAPEHRPPEQQSPEQAPVPCKTSCCCQQDVAQPKSPEAAPQGMTLALFALPDRPPVAVAPPAAFAGDLTLHDPSPPVRVLHCVWLC